MQQLIVCNWKMNPASLKVARSLFDGTKKQIANLDKVHVIVAPPAVFLPALAQSYRGKRITFAAQTIANETDGSYTGELSATQMKDAGAAHTIIGHAERRVLGETDADMHAKVHEALRLKLKVILAVGEAERDAHGAYITTIREQIATALADVPPTRLKDITIAYEPVWAIGALEAPDAHAVHQMILLVRKILVEQCGDRGARMRILYGGAVNEDNAESICAVPDIGGVLVGRASLEPMRLKGIIRAANHA